MSSTLHDEARQSQNHLANGDDSSPPFELAANWRDWSWWVADQQDAIERFQQGVVAFTAEFIHGVKDPNRVDGQLRLDFCLLLADGSYWRFHPGSTRKSSAKPRFFPAEIHDTATTTDRGAAEHASMQWTTAGESGIFSLSRARLVPQIDKLGKQQMWSCV